MRKVRILLCVVAFQFGGHPAEAEIRGPCDLPTHLPGLWSVSLCTSDTHAWIRFEHATTGEVHTLGRYNCGFGGVVDRRTGRQVWPTASACGVLWDFDLKYDLGIQTGQTLRSCQVWNPPVFRGRNDGFGHWGVRMNCATYARDAWCFYCGERYDLRLIATPRTLDDGVRRNHTIDCFSTGARIRD